MANEKETPDKKSGFKPVEVAGVKIEIKPGWEHLVHALVEKGPVVNPNTGERLSKPYVHHTDPKQWDLTKGHFASIGLKIHDVYEPSK